MSLTTSVRVRCQCGTFVDGTIFRSLNVADHPEAREAVLERRLHALVCEACGQLHTVEPAFAYVDMDRRQLFGVFPEASRLDPRPWLELTVQSWETAGRPDDVLVRAVFGIEELREKIVLHEAGLDDLALEVMKGDLLAHGGFRELGVATLFLDKVVDQGLIFVPFSGPEQRLDRPEPVSVKRSLYDTYHRLGRRLLEVRPGIASGPHVSVLRLGLA